MDKRRQRESPRNYVVDASVVAKWVLPVETYQENAFLLKQDQTTGLANLFAPSIITLEVTNALWQAVRLKRVSEENAKDALKTLADTNITLQQTNWNQTSEMLDIAFKLGITIYDAAYIFLSTALRAQLVTSDTKLYEKAKGHFQILHLKDYV
jgi:predicted nucleic acid-binding protein